MAEINSKCLSLCRTAAPLGLLVRRQQQHDTIESGFADRKPFLSEDKNAAAAVHNACARSPLSSIR
ncbi:hypothetical protein [Nocardia farcinica]|uniref:hypothetical protein n=1 Tax=Nocardia farcinica TaxID=37329 RepID=UPI001893DF9E|nr:hypothetical protein [Nocardia farcinica]MBF6376442.1 hypothetical protein [Nocardia farcinica]